MDPIDAAIAAIETAAFIDDNWQPALRKTAEASGSWAGHLLGLTHTKEVLWNQHSGVGEEVVGEFDARMAHAAHLNPRARVLSAPEMVVFTDANFIDLSARDRNPFYREFYSEIDAPHCGIARITSGPGDLNVVLAVLRSRRMGEISDTEQRALAALLPYWRTATRTKGRQDGAAAAVVANTLDRLSATAFVLNRWGRIVAMSAAAERLVTAGDLLRISTGGRLQATVVADAVRLDRAILQALADPSSPAPKPVVVSGPDGPRAIDVTPLPARLFDIEMGPAAMVVLTPLVRQPDEALRILCDAYGLTGAEAAVALDVVLGRDLHEIGEARRVRIHTLRTQLKAIFGKVGVTSRAELVARTVKLTGIPGHP